MSTSNMNMHVWAGHPVCSDYSFHGKCLFFHRYRSIYLAADGRSLHLAAQSLMGQQKLKKLGIAPRPDESMVYCNECGDGGELLLCTSCPRSYHEGMLLVLTLSVIIVFLLEQALCRLCAQPRSLMCLMGYLLGRLCGVEECSSFCW